MRYEFNVYSSPPTFTYLELIRKRDERIRLGYLLAIAIVLAMLIMRMNERFHLNMPDSWMTDWRVLFPVVATIVLVWRLIKHGRKMFRLHEAGPETLDALLCSEVPVVTAYCQAVQNQHRMLTMEEAEALTDLCSAPEAIKKIAESYDRYDEEHPNKAVWYG